ncbi:MULTISPECIES: helix-turn-helix domain-containing protein [unclassified Streptomyces]|uniref:winged helix-turn-helix domain-containing protein n=1 Tax=unclassified Streptomyces TaxID=2593676 RepID=UPI000DBAA681|nr:MULTISPECIES: helix-turn-helix domain-containing protein [unclassified Streptomyces]MYT70511.1 helix-turn-helix domain-containing protein [Streptomyces sp. SID8367]RAJ90211.1 helix-turn-helix protein [Streptomyces sp. PsTaAH-137]
MTESRRIADLATLKAFGHPLRMRLYGALKLRGTATASQLADDLDDDTAVSLVSYHLRKLAEHGLIEEAERAGGDARERWWQAAQESLRIDSKDFRDTPEGAAAHTALSRVMYDHRRDAYLRFLEQRAGWSPEWQDAHDSSDFMARLTPDELKALTAELHAVVARYEKHGRTADPEGRETVGVHLYAFPMRG